MTRPTAAAAAATLALLLLLAPGGAPHAQAGIRIYRCTDATGAVTIQNDTPCPKGARQTVQVIDPPPALPAYVPRIERMPDIVAVEQAARDAALEARLEDEVPAPVPEGERTPPPPLYQCRTWDDETYLTDSTTPTERCAPLQLVGLDGRPLRGSAGACEKRVDTCAAIPEENLCRSWRRRVDEAEFRWKFAGARDDDRRVEYEKWAAILANSTCDKG
ncbi:hypothetical protein GCM10028862_20610 [Luteimonas pelagia]